MPTPDPACCPAFSTHVMSEATATELADLFAGLADPTRLRLLSLIVAEDEVYSCNLEEPLGRSQPTISHHTRILADLGLIIGERRGRWVYWRADRARIASVQSALQLDEQVNQR